MTLTSILDSQDHFLKIKAKTHVLLLICFFKRWNMHTSARIIHIFYTQEYSVYFEGAFDDNQVLPLQVLAFLKSSKEIKPEDQWSCKRSPESAAYTNKHVRILWYLTPVQGQMKPWAVFFFRLINILSMDASRQVSLKSIYWFQRRRYLKGFYHIWAWWPSWSCDLDY